MPNIKHQITIEAPARKIYPLMTTKNGIQQWLRKEDGWQITGEEKVGGILSFHFGGNHHDMEIIQLVPDKEVKWHCPVGHPEWIGTSVQFTIESKEGKSILHFEHSDWKSQSEFFNQCSQVWAGNLEDIKLIAES